MLSIFLTEELETLAQTKKDVQLVFYFCSHQDEKRNTGVAVLRGLIHQIVVKRPELVKHVLPYLETPERSQLMLSSVEALWIVFRKLVQDADLGAMFCVLDGLDECDQDVIPVLVSKINDLFSPQDSHPTTNLKLVVVSREVPGLHSCMQVKLDPNNEDRIVSDIKRFVKARVAELSIIEGFNDEFRKTVQVMLLERSEGTFLWVGFVVTELSKKRTCSEVLDTLRSFPKGLPAIYSRMLLQIDESHRRTSSAILRWVTMAVRPLELEELAAAVDIQSSTLITTNRAIRDHITLCGSILKIQEHEVHLVHQSVRDYLVRKEPDSNAVLEEFRIKQEEAHLEIAQTCFSCVANSGLQHAPLVFDRKYSLQESALIKYAALHWPEHAIGCSTKVVKLFDLSEPFFSHKTSSLRMNWWHTYRRVQWVSPSVSLLHMACHIGILPWVRAILDKKSWVPFQNLVDKRDNNGRTPLHWAAMGGHEPVVQLLLDRGAHVNAKDNSGRTALRSATSKGYEAVVRLLLKHSADVNAIDSDGWTVLRLAVSEGHGKVVRLLLDGGADVNTKSQYGLTALNSAVSNGHDEVARLLLDRNANVNAGSTEGRSALLSATSNGYEMMVRMLLDYGADVNMKSENGLTALHLAASNGHETVTQLLLDHNADVNAKDKDGWVALRYSAAGGFNAIVRLLLDRGADVNVVDGGGRAALDLAASHGEEAIVRLLLDRGANVDAEDSTGRTALYSAAFEEHEVVVALLLDAGADINVRKKFGTWLLGPTRFCYEVERLLEKWSVRQISQSHSGLVDSKSSSRLSEWVSSSDLTAVKILDARSGRCLQILEGHDDVVNSVAFSHDSMRLVSASDDGTVRVWDANGEECLQTLRGHKAAVNSAAFSHDSTRLVSASDDRTVKIWDAVSGECLHMLEDHNHCVCWVAFSHDSTRLASASVDQTVKIWETSSGKCLKTLECHCKFTNFVVFSHDSARVATVSKNNTVKIWDVSKSGQCLQILDGHTHWVSSIVFSPDSTWLASASYDKTVKIWDTSSGVCLQTLEGHSHWVNSVTISHDATLLASASNDQTIKVWDPSTGECLQTILNEGDMISSVAFSHDSTRLASASNDIV